MEQKNTEVSDIDNETPEKKKPNKKKKIVVVVCSAVLAVVIAAGAFAGASYAAEKSRYEEAKLQAGDNIICEKEYELDNEEHELKAEDFISAAEGYESDSPVDTEVQFDDSKGLSFTADEVKDYSYKIVVTVSDNKIWNSFKAFDLDCRISVVDTTPPEFTDNIEEIKITQGEKLNLSGKFKATDLSGDAVITVDGEVDAEKVGTQTVKVCAADKNGNTAEKEVKITVEAKPEEKTEASSSGSSTAASSSKSTTSSSSSSTKSSSSGSSSSNGKTSSSNKISGASSSSSSTTTTSAYWCTEGGSHHAYDVGQIGWYSSYEEAVSAVDKYITVNGGSHAKYTQCLCGLWTATIN